MPVQPSRKLKTAMPSTEGTCRTMAMIVGSQYIRTRKRIKLIFAPLPERQHPLYRMCTRL
jgi:hypothetical protein